MLPVDHMDGLSLGVVERHHVTASRGIRQLRDALSALELGCLGQVVVLFDLKGATEELLGPGLGIVDILVHSVAGEPDAVHRPVRDLHAKVEQEGRDGLEVWMLVTHMHKPLDTDLEGHVDATVLAPFRNGLAAGPKSLRIRHRGAFVERCSAQCLERCVSPFDSLQTTAALGTQGLMNPYLVGGR